MLEQGIVVDIKKSQAVVRIMRTSACGNCSMCGLTADKKFIDIDVENTLNAKKGDTVSIELSGNLVVKLSLIVYLLPLFFAFVLLICGAVFKLEEYLQIILFTGGLIVGFVIVRVIDKKISKKGEIIPLMKEIVATSTTEIDA